MDTNVFYEKFEHQCTVNHIFLTADNGEKFKVYVIKDKSRLINKDQIAYIYNHGGGVVLLNAEINVPRMCRVAIENQAVVFVVDYRKAPETKSKECMKDCYDVVQHIWENNRKYCVSRKKIVLSGCSGGAYIAVGASMMLAQKN